MKNILWLASWYPNEADPFTGDFIQRQAEAVSLFQDIRVIYVGKLTATSMRNRSNIEQPALKGKEQIGYYSGSPKHSGWFQKIRSAWSYFKTYRQLLSPDLKKGKYPDLVHVHVAMRAGLVALYLYRRYQIPYILTEHWTGYYEEADDNLFGKSFLYRYFTRRILKNAARLIPVSEALGKQIGHYWADVPFTKIPNVVNTKLFYPALRSQGKPFRFIHVSSLMHQKNPEGILRSFLRLIEEGFDAELVMVGPLQRMTEIMLPYAGKTFPVRFIGEISYSQVGEELRKSDALVMFSRYENLPCIILEALCTGLPVIATRVGGIPEIVSEENGIIIEPEIEKGLQAAMQQIIEGHSGYERNKIAEQAARLFSYETVGKAIGDLYTSVLEEKH